MMPNLVQAIELPFKVLKLKVQTTFSEMFVYIHEMKFKSEKIPTFYDISCQTNKHE